MSGFQLRRFCHSRALAWRCFSDDRSELEEEGDEEGGGEEEGAEVPRRATAGLLLTILREGGAAVAPPDPAAAGCFFGAGLGSVRGATFFRCLWPLSSFVTWGAGGDGRRVADAMRSPRQSPPGPGGV